MSAAVVLDGRCRPLRRQLGPAAWMVLEEAALSAYESEEEGLWAPLSIRSAASATGLGRESVARAVSSLVSAGVLRRADTQRTCGGRFGAGSYWLMAPAGVVVSGVTAGGRSGDPGRGGPRPVAPAAVDTEELSGKKDSRREGGRRDEADRGSAVQTSLFATGVEEEGAGLVAAGGTPRAGVESVGAVSSVGCEVVSRVHELAPEVRAGAGPGFDPHPSDGGGGGC